MQRKVGAGFLDGITLVHPIAVEIASHLRFVNRDMFFMRMMER
jgi:hypothetical protein